MDQVIGDRLREMKLDSIADALSNGLILVRPSGEIAWMDEKLRRRVNGRLQNIELPVRESDESGIDCFVTAANVMINGEPSEVCVIQEKNQQNNNEAVRENEIGRDLVAAIEAVMTNASNAIVDKLHALRQVTRPQSHPSGLELLTQREREVLALICEGRSDAEMSRMLGLSPNTVRNHIASLFRKIGVNRRGAAIIWARERGITGRDLLNGNGRGRPHAADRNETY